MLELKKLLALSLSLAVFACTGDVPDRDTDEEEPPPEEIDDPLVGAGDRDITQFWPDIDLPYSENTKVLTFDMLRNEVLRATGKSWVVDSSDMWEQNRSVLGGPDYVNTFGDDRSISQQKVVALRKMAFTVCGDVVADDTAGVFGGVDTAATIAADDPAVTAQIEATYTRFFLVAPSAAQVAESAQLLVDLQAQESPAEAWRGLCAGYLASMRFLTY